MSKGGKKREERDGEFVTRATRSIPPKIEKAASKAAKRSYNAAKDAGRAVKNKIKPPPPKVDLRRRFSAPEYDRLTKEVQAAKKELPLKKARGLPTTKQTIKITRQPVGQGSSKALARLQAVKKAAGTLPKLSAAGVGRAAKAAGRFFGKRASAGPDLGAVKEQIKKADIRKIPGTGKHKPLPSRASFEKRKKR